MRPFNLISCWILPFLILTVAIPCVLSLHVVPGSNCTGFCSDQNPLSNTTSGDVTCRDNDYESTAVGKTFKDCVTCEFESKSFDQGTRQTDLGWGLYNIRYTLDWCLFGLSMSAGKISVASCDKSCESTKASLNVQSANFSAPTPYGYCEDWDHVAFTDCAACYAKVPDQSYLSNFLHLLSSACEWQIVPPTNFPIRGSQVFTHNPPSNYSTADPNSSSDKSTGLSSNSKLAIGIIIPVVLLLILVSLIVLWYFKFHLPTKTPASASEPEFQLYARPGEKGSPKQDYQNPTVYHPTPALQHTHYPPPFRLHPPPLGRQGGDLPKIRVETGATVGNPPPLRVPGSSPVSTHSAMKNEEGNHTKRKSKVTFDIRGKASKKDKHAEGKESEDLFS